MNYLQRAREEKGQDFSPKYGGYGTCPEREMDISTVECPDIKFKKEHGRNPYSAEELCEFCWTMERG